MSTLPSAYHKFENAVVLAMLVVARKQQQSPYFSLTRADMIPEA